jgi:hypothetical protein
LLGGLQGADGKSTLAEPGTVASLLAYHVIMEDSGGLALSLIDIAATAFVMLLIIVAVGMAVLVRRK